MAKNRLSKLIAASLCFALSISGVSAKEYLVAGAKRFEGQLDFEDFEIGIASDASKKYGLSNGVTTIDKVLSIDEMKGNMIAEVAETTDKNGNTTKALHYYVNGTSKYADQDTLLLQFRPDTDKPNLTNIFWNPRTLGKYFVYKLKFKSGGDGHGYFKGSANNWAGCATVDWQNGKADFGGSANTQAFALDEWVDFEFVVDRTDDTKDVQYMRFNCESLGKKEFVRTTYSKMEIKNSNPRWLAWLYGGSSSPENPSLWIDDMEVYVTDYKITSQLNGRKDVQPKNTIELDIEGDIDETSLDNIIVTNGTTPVGISDISIEKAEESEENAKCIITLEEKMKDFSDYTVDVSNVCSETGLKKKMPEISFSTIGKIAISADLTAEKMSNNELSAVSEIEPGIIQTTFTAKNITNVTANNVVLCARLMKDGEIKGINYSVQNVAYGETAVLKSAFLVPDNTYTIEAFAKNSLNGNVYYTDVYMLSQSGIANAAAPEEDEFANIAESATADGTVKFHNISFGENGKSEEVTSLKSGLTEAAAKSSKGMLISVLKKDNKIAALSYSVCPENGGTMHSAVYVPEDGGYTFDAFVWSDIKGTEAYMPKVGISSEAEGN